MRRREFIRLLRPSRQPLLGGAASASRAAGRWGSSSWFAAEGASLEAFRQGLSETGYVAGRNVAVEYHYAEDNYDRFPALAAELVRRRVSVIFTNSTAGALSAKAATATIPIVFQ